MLNCVDTYIFSNKRVYFNIREKEISDDYPRDKIGRFSDCFIDSRTALAFLCDSYSQWVKLGWEVNVICLKKKFFDDYAFTDNSMKCVKEIIPSLSDWNKIGSIYV